MADPKPSEPAGGSNGNDGIPEPVGKGSDSGEPAGGSNGNDPTPEPVGKVPDSGEPAGGDPNIEVAPKKGRNHLTQSQLQEMWSEKVSGHL